MGYLRINRLDLHHSTLWALWRSEAVPPHFSPIRVGRVMDGGVKHGETVEIGSYEYIEI